MVNPIPILLIVIMKARITVNLEHPFCAPTAKSGTQSIHLSPRSVGSMQTVQTEWKTCSESNASFYGILNSTKNEFQFAFARMKKIK